MVNFIQPNNKDIIITTNKITTISDLNIVEKYVKDLNNVDSSNTISPKLSQSKFYLKILDILYCVEDTNLSITADIVKRVIQTTYIFNDVVLTSCLYIIKAFPKSDIAIIQVDIQNSQNSTKDWLLINRCFNITYHITTIRETNMNSSISQYKNCWKQEFMC